MALREREAECWNSRENRGNLKRYNGLLIAFLLFLSLFVLRGMAEDKPPSVSVESFVSSLDRDGDGEICAEEANKFLASVLESTSENGEAEGEEKNLSEATAAGVASRHDTSMSELMNNHNLNISFNYGGSTISVSEMTDHLAHMLTGDRVVAWVIHGLRLPQYADSFEENSIDGLDFPALISDNGAALRDDLGVTSGLHRNKIQSALVRQVFGIGQVPGPPTSLVCRGLAEGEGILLQWKPPAEMGIPPLHKFLIKRRMLSANGMTGGWEELGDTSDESWWDDQGLEVGAEYEYRVQAWGQHGPSPWDNVTGCKVALHSVGEVPANAGGIAARGLQYGDRGALALGEGPPQSPNPSYMASPDELVATEKQTSSEGDNDSGGAGGKEGSGEKSGSTQAGKEDAGEGTVLGFVLSVNGGILILGLISRSSLLFRTFSSVSAATLDFLQRWVPSTNSQSMVARRLAKATQDLAHALYALGLAILAALGMSPQHASEASQSPAGAERQPPLFSSSRTLSASSSGHASSTSNGNTSSSSNLHASFISSGDASADSARLHLPLSQEPAHNLHPNAQEQQQTVRRRLALQHQVSSGCADVASEDHVLHEGNSDEGSKSSGEGAHPGRLRGPVRAMLSIHDHTSNSKYRCNADNCDLQFNSISGFLEKLKSHYCRDCQSWYCSRHTRIASHSSHFCRLDSHCRCFSCFARLGADQQLALERINKLHAPKARNGETSSRRNGRNSNPTRVPEVTSDLPEIPAAIKNRSGARRSSSPAAEVNGVLHHSVSAAAQLSSRPGVPATSRSGSLSTNGSGSGSLGAVFHKSVSDIALVKHSGIQGEENLLGEDEEVRQSGNRGHIAMKKCFLNSRPEGDTAQQVRSHNEQGTFPSGFPNISFNGGRGELTLASTSGRPETGLGRESSKEKSHSSPMPILPEGVESMGEQNVERSPLQAGQSPQSKAGKSPERIVQRLLSNVAKPASSVRQPEIEVQTSFDRLDEDPAMESGTQGAPESREKGKVMDLWAMPGGETPQVSVSGRIVYGRSRSLRSENSKLLRGDADSVQLGGTPAQSHRSDDGVPLQERCTSLEQLSVLGRQKGGGSMEEVNALFRQEEGGAGEILEPDLSSTAGKGDSGRSILSTAKSISKFPSSLVKGISSLSGMLPGGHASKGSS